MAFAYRASFGAPDLAMELAAELAAELARATRPASASLAAFRFADSETAMEQPLLERVLVYESFGASRAFGASVMLLVLAWLQQVA